MSPFQVNHSGVLGALLQFLTAGEAEGEGAAEREAEGEGRDNDELVAACEARLRLFLHVFADMPLVAE